MGLKILLLTATLISLHSHAAFNLSYSGRLVNANGSPVTSEVDLRFRFYYTDGSTNTLVCTKTVSDIDLSGTNGVFHVKIPFTDATDSECVGNKTIEQILVQIPAGEDIAIQVSDLTNSKDYDLQNLHPVPMALMAKTLGEISGVGDGDVLKWNATNKKWEPASDIGGDGGFTSSSGSQLAVGYDNSNKLTFDVSSGGDTTFTAAGSSPSFSFVGGPVDVQGSSNSTSTLFSLTGTSATALTMGFVGDGTAPTVPFIRTSGNLPLSLGTTGSPDAIRIMDDGKVGIGMTAPQAPEGILELVSTSSGFILPRMTGAQRDAISPVPLATQIYNTDTDQLNYYNGAAWVILDSAVSTASNRVVTTDATGAYQFTLCSADEVVVFQGGVLPVACVNPFNEGDTILAGNGSVSAPGISFSGDSDTGIFSPSDDSNEIGISVNGNEKVRISNEGIATSGKVRLKSDNTNYVELEAPSSLAATTTYTFPATAGTSGYILSTNGSGALSWIAPSDGVPTGAAGGDLSGTYPNPTISGLDAAKVGGGGVSNTEFGYLDGVTLAVQTQIDSKQGTITAGTTAQYYRGDKSWQTLDTAAVAEGTNLYFLDSRVRTALMSGYAAGSAVPVAATDTLIEAIAKLEGQIIANDAVVDGMWVKTGTDLQYTAGKIQATYIESYDTPFTRGSALGSFAAKGIRAAGKITLTNGSSTILGIGTTFLGDYDNDKLAAWYQFSLNGKMYNVHSISDETTAKLADDNWDETVWTGPTVTADLYLTGGTATGIGAVSLGLASIASGSDAFASNWNSKATGSGSTAMSASTSSGSNSVALAMGNASGTAAVAMSNATASGQNAIAMGQNSLASAYASVAIGTNLTASNMGSMAFGLNNVSSGEWSMAAGVATTSPGYLETTFGRYNVITGTESPTNWISTDPLFVIGNGVDNSNRANAFTVLKNGNVGIGASAPAAKLEVNGNVKAASFSTGTQTISSPVVNTWYSTSIDVTSDSPSMYMVWATQPSGASWAYLHFGTENGNGNPITITSTPSQNLAFQFSGTTLQVRSTLYTSNITVIWHKIK